MQLTTINIDRQLVRYASHGVRQPQRWSEFQQRLALCWLYHDFALEGTALLERDLQHALSGAQGRHWSEGRLYEQLRHTHHAIDTILATRRDPRRVFELEDLKSFHVMIMPAEDPAAGRYRKELEPPPHYGHEVTRPPSISYRLRKLAESMAAEYRRMHPIRAAALIHHDFMTAWPFDERTGTAGRLLLNAWLLSAGYPPAIVPALQRQEYFDALIESPERMTPIVLEGIHTTLKAADGFFDQAASSLVA